MLIHLDSAAAADAISASATAARSRAAIENLLLAHFEGNHVISMLPEDAATLRMATPPWSERARRALDHIDEAYPQIAGLRADAPWALELVLGPSFDGKIHDLPGGAKVLRAPLHSFEKSHQAACSVLLGENSADADFLCEVGLMRRAERGWEAVGMVHEARGTGGSTFAPEYRQLADRGRILLAVADSDKRHPKGGHGGTYKKLEAEARGRPAYQRARCLPTRTAEALVPPSVYRAAFQCLYNEDYQCLGSLDRLEPFLRSAPSDTILHADVKRGITIFQIDHFENEAERSYWGEIAKKAKRDQCTRSSLEQCTKREDCRCYVVDALGDKALADVVTWMKARKSKRDLAARFDLSRNADLSALADEVLAWGLALPPLLT